MRQRNHTASLFTAFVVTSAMMLQSASAFLMWKAERNDATIHIIAKVDFISPDAAELIAPSVTQAFDASDVIVYELQMDPVLKKQDRKRIVQSAIYSPGDNLVRHLPKDAVSDFNKVCEKYRINNNGIVRVKPWAAAYKLNRIAMTKAGVETLDFLDEHFFSLMGSSGKSPDYLTKPDEAIALYKNIPSNASVQMFKKLLSEAQQKPAMIKKYAAVWQSGDAKAAADLVNNANKNYTVFRDAVTSKLSSNWAAKLTAMTKYDDSIFAIIPLENTVGAASLLKNLEADGFAVTQVE